MKRTLEKLFHVTFYGNLTILRLGWTIVRNTRVLCPKVQPNRTLQGRQEKVRHIGHSILLGEGKEREEGILTAMPSVLHGALPTDMVTGGRPREISAVTFGRHC